MSARQSRSVGTPERYGWRPVDPPARPALFINPLSGGDRTLHTVLTEGASERGISASVLRPGEDLAALVAEAVAGGADALGMAGGDGSLAVVADAAHAHGLPFVCIPAGTRNHFARDLGVDRHDPVGALDAFTDGVERLIDMGSVNGRLFLNNVSLGIYGEAVSQPRYRDAKVRTLLETVRKVLGPSAAASELIVIDEGGREHRHPTVVLVSNNPYAFGRALVEGTRPTLSSGRIGVLVLEEPAIGEKPARAWITTAFEVSGPAIVHAGVDGEAVDLRPPLEFRILPAALRVRISARHPGVSPSGLLP